ncbi:MAG: metalloprotease TldD [Alphaproteobacteria bacterium]|nr:metalloprotease TldD [Alphaproteobacteria bacterium]
MESSRAIANRLFFGASALDATATAAVLDDALRGAEDGELYLEHTLTESLTFDDGVLKSASFDATQGMGLRAVLGERVAYAHASSLSLENLKQAAATVRAVHDGKSGTVNLSPSPAPYTSALYTDEDPVLAVPFEEKIKLLQEIDAYVRAKDARVRQVTVSLFGQWQVVHILRSGGASASDVRPLVRLNISVVLEENGRMERGSSGAGGRTGYAPFIIAPAWKRQSDEALRQADVNLKSRPAPAGEMPVVLGSGWPGVLLHEAVGHGLEGDFNRKKTSVYSGLMGQRIAAPGVTVIDDGTMHERRGSLSVDDEGTPTGRTTLIEDGILVGYLQDRQNARLMGVAPTGNGRRESYAYAPMPRMTNTFMLGGSATREDLIKSVKRGVYAANFGGGQVDITSGKFVFSASEAYLIEDGKVTAPIKGATLIGNGADTMKRVTGIGNDLELDPGIGTCGKAGQGVPVGVGQPSLLISGMTVGGTEV